MGTMWTSTSTSGTGGMVERLRTFIHPVSYSNLFLISLSMIYALILLLCSFFTAYIL